jgi:hypothetical protein
MIAAVRMRINSKHGIHAEMRHPVTGGARARQVSDVRAAPETTEEGAFQPEALVAKTMGPTKGEKSAG